MQLKSTLGAIKMGPTYKFDGYVFRPAAEGDVELARRWNAADPEHQWEARFPDYWVEQNGVVNSYVLEDTKGILFFMKSIRCSGGKEIEINIQFDRARSQVSALRLMVGLSIGFDWLKKALPMNGFEAVYFVSRNRNLCTFAEQRLGFAKDGGREIFRFDRGERHGQVRRSQTQQAS